MNITDYKLTDDQLKDVENRIHNFLSKLDCDICISDYVSIKDIEIDSLNVYDDIYNEIEDGSRFDIDVIYYSNAIEYLSENDPSLRKSLSLANELGFTCDNLSSETLASLLKSQNVKNDFSNLETEINDFFAEIVTELEDLTVNED